MQKIWLWTELGCNCDERESVISRQRIKGDIVDSNSEGEESGSRVIYRVMVMCSIRSSGVIRLQLEFRSSSPVRVSARISLRFKVK